MSTHPKFKEDKRKSGCGKSRAPLPYSSHESFNHDTDRNYSFFLLPPWCARIFCSPSLSSLVFNTPHPFLSPSLHPWPLHQSRLSLCIWQHSYFHTTPHPPSLSTYCRALMSTLARPVNYSITGRRISDSPPPTCYSKNRLSYVGSELFTAIRNWDAHCSVLMELRAPDLTPYCEILGQLSSNCFALVDVCAI